MRKCVLLLAVLLVGATAPAQADIIFDRGPDSNLNQGWTSNVGGAYITYNSFSLLPGETTITEIRWWGSYFDNFANLPLPAVDDFTIQIVGDDNGLPDLTGPLFLDFDAGNNVDRTEKVGDTFLGYPSFRYQATIAPLTLSANTTYWLTVFNDTNPAWTWLESFDSTVSTAPYAVSGSSLTYYGSLHESRAFQLVDNTPGVVTSPVVPEPATVTLLGIGLAALGYRRVRGAGK